MVDVDPLEAIDRADGGPELLKGWVSEHPEGQLIQLTGHSLGVDGEQPRMLRKARCARLLLGCTVRHLSIAGMQPNELCTGRASCGLARAAPAPSIWLHRPERYR